MGVAGWRRGDTGSYCHEVLTANFQSLDFFDYLEPTLRANIVSSYLLNDQTKQLWNNELASNPDFDKLKNVELNIKGGNTKSLQLITNAYNDKREELNRSRFLISALEKEIDALQTTISGLNQQLEAQNSIDNIAFSTLAKDAKIRFNDLEYFGYAKMLESRDFIKIDTLSIANVKWKASVNDSIAQVKEDELLIWLKQVLKTEKVSIKRY